MNLLFLSKIQFVIEVFRDYIISKSQVGDAELDQIIAAAQVKKVRKRQYLLQQGDVWKYDAFVTMGCFRTYSVDDKGTEHILTFSPENWWTGERASYASGEPSIYNIEALEESEVALIPKATFERLCKDIPAFNDMINAILQKSFVVAQGRIHNAISLSAEDRYAQFIAKYPDIAMRVPQGMIASYLGITPETLSRVRKQGAKKK